MSTSTTYVSVNMNFIIIITRRQFHMTTDDNLLFLLLEHVNYHVESGLVSLHVAFGVAAYL